MFVSFFGVDMVRAHLSHRRSLPPPHSQLFRIHNFLLAGPKADLPDELIKLQALRSNMEVEDSRELFAIAKEVSNATGVLVCSSWSFHLALESCFAGLSLLLLPEWMLLPEWLQCGTVVSCCLVCAAGWVLPYPSDSGAPTAIND